MFSLGGMPRFSAPAREADEAKEKYMPVPGGEADDLARMEEEWNNRLTYPTGRFNPAWVRQQRSGRTDKHRIPLGIPATNLKREKARLLQGQQQQPDSTQPVSPRSDRSAANDRLLGCFDYTTTEVGLTILW